MQIIEDPKIFRPLLQQAIEKYGYAPEHNADWFEKCWVYSGLPAIALFDDDMVLMVFRDGGEWNTFSEPIAPQSIGGKLVAEFARMVLSDGKIAKVVTEGRTNTRKQILKSLPDHLRTCRINYTLTWPVMNMEKFDPALFGSHFKSLRNARSKFYREHEVEMMDCRLPDSEALAQVVKDWAQKRHGRDRSYPQIYQGLIQNNFKGMQTVRAMKIDGKIAAFNAGWEIPNSDVFYGGVGVHDYSIRDLGLMLYLEDLIWIKSAGYKIADMGGVERGSPLNFKNQFLPESWYKTFIFSIVRR